MVSPQEVVMQSLGMVVCSHVSFRHGVQNCSIYPVLLTPLTLKGRKFQILGVSGCRSIGLFCTTQFS